MVNSLSVDQYIAGYPKEVQEVLRHVRGVIRTEVPRAIESISYGIPAYTLDGKPLIYFAAFRDHISIYPTNESLESALPAVLDHKTGKGTLQFSLHKSLPISLVTKIVRFKLKEYTERK